MRLLFSERPGRHERHLLRRFENPLFPETVRELTQAQLTEAQRLDHEELVAYIGELRRLVGEAVSLGPHEQSDVILDLKERLDKAYETACRLADDQTPNKEAIRKLVDVIMRSVWKGAGNDTLAHQELQQEEAARQAHYELLENPLVADLLDPESLIAKDELLPVLLCAGESDFEAALTLFDAAQLEALLHQGEKLAHGDSGSKLSELGAARLHRLRTGLDSLQTG
ncbi:MAG: hypothetical protein B6D72_07295 [gamma proteobacterium symbiont of Ctena orbiculata]|uniref:Uncharacterized protein n=1 Tax=Candidatus Thiodiazotropha taylori TaxID=2792791 RepID=A0A944MCW0_9GAMM|nr:hypothetical protein [Candidatus Thiodiazotropha taylori]PUB88790.1 MAG: hypothetical protein DBP00_04605 [gamma proteobacterium symbiont of Ctena orbiculata]MBT2989588.1 hypothetical protein [Candidatus Thiodiazotropha taylori]MBT2997168.1 hypothetical protein [Candidatus Thiodiazotropha taylori]MBT3001321.1 hypothetical protein [Candidatus Thiodiazotropha taylori]